MSKKYFTSESVTEGHPDKICDQISDAVLDEILKNDSDARVACETVCTTGMVMLMGEISTKCYVDISKIVRSVIKDIGYNEPEYGFDYASCAVISNIDEQSPDIAMGVDKALETRNSDKMEIGAGDQGMMFGFACDETPELMPMPIMYSHKLAKRLSEVRKNNIIPYLRPDGKTQVTIEYENDVPVAVDTIVVSTQHDENIDLDRIKSDIIEHVIKPTIPSNLISKETKIFVNPTGKFIIGGPVGDSGLTGRKTMVDTYGGYSRHGGGAFSGKDPTKVDRTGAYVARYVAKNIVAAGLAKRCEVQLAYAIGVAHPVSIMLDTFNTGVYSDDVLEQAIKVVFDFKPGSIIDYLNLKKPIYKQLSAYGHLGRDDLDVSWEKTDKVDELKTAINKIIKNK